MTATMQAEKLTFSAGETARAIRAGEVTAEEVTRACLARIEEIEPTIHAWAHLAPDLAIEQAKEADRARRNGRTLGPLHGVPVGVKDIFDTKDMPTEYGTPIHAGRRPVEDATAVALMRQAGAVILGKTVTTEYATMHPGPTANPHDPTRTPGGSSSGSAAAVAAGMVPIALGTQTNGSVIRPASYCGVVGFKPTFGLIPRHRVLKQSPPLDQIGVFGRTVEDVALAAQSAMGHDNRDPASRPVAVPDLWGICAGEPPMPPTLGLFKGPVWDQAEETTREAFAELQDFLGERAGEAEVAPVFDEAAEWHRKIMVADLAKNFAADFEKAPDQFSEILTGMIQDGREVRAVDYNLGLDRIEMFARAMEPLFEDFDALMTPAVAGEAPEGLASTGSPAFCTLWTFCGMPAVTLPILQGPAGLPLGVQLVGRRGDDARLLRTARWLMDKVAAEAEG